MKKQLISYLIKNAKDITLNQKVIITGRIHSIAGNAKSKDITVEIAVDEFEKDYKK